MNQKTRSSTRLAATATLAAFAAVLLAACGSSSTTPSAKSAATTTPGAGAPGTAGAGGGRFQALRECLKQQGITLPQRIPGQGGQGAPPAGGALPFSGGGQGTTPPLPKGVTRGQYEAALKKCGGGRFRGGGVARLRNPTFTKALGKFAECMRQNGVAVPAPNTSGKGPIFSTKGLDTKSATFRAVEQKCASLLNFARPGGQGAPPGGMPAG